MPDDSNVIDSLESKRGKRQPPQRRRARGEPSALQINTAEAQVPANGGEDPPAPSTPSQDPATPVQPTAPKAEPQGAPALEWSGTTDVTSLRMPSELLADLDRRVAKLRITKTVAVAAAIDRLLTLDDDALLAVADQAEDRLERARRQARRGRQ